MASIVDSATTRCAKIFSACAMCCVVACQTTTTPVHGPAWLPKQPPASAERTDEPAQAPQSASISSEPKPWDAPATASQSVLTPPSAEQMSEYLSGATWIKLDENGTRRRSLQLNADGTFVAKSDGQSGEMPAFEGLVVQAKGRWSAKTSELRLMPRAGDPVVVQLLWLGDKRIIMMNGESWIRSQ